MKPSSSSKNPKKISNEDRSKKKTIKSKSSKRRRSRQHSSISSYSSSDSDSEEISRSRRKSSKSKKLVDKRKSGSKKLKKKSLRKKKRSHRDSSSSDSSSGCSTCSDSKRSRSPVRKSKVKKRVNVRGRKSSHIYESSRGRNRRSLSCSTCSGGSRRRSSSRGRSRSPIEEEFEHGRKQSASVERRVDNGRERSPVEERLVSSRERSPIDERFEGSGWSPINDRFESRRGRSPIDDIRFDSSRGWSPIEDRFGSRCKRGPTEDRFGSSRGRSPIDERFGNNRVHSTIGERFEGGRGRSHIDDKLESSHGRSPVKESFASRGRSPIDGTFESSCGRSPIEDRCWDQGGTKRLRSVIVVTKSADEHSGIIKAYDDYPSSRSNDFYCEGNNKRESNVEDGEKDPYDTRFREEVISSNDRCEDEGKEATDLELILRQKALENFKKFRGGRPAKLETLDDKKDEISEPQSLQHSNFFAKTLDHMPHSSVDDQTHVHGETHLNKLKGRSVPNLSIDKVDGNSVRINSNAQNASSRLIRVRQSSSKISSEQSSLTNNNQNKVVAQPSGAKVNGTEVDTVDSPASGAHNIENQNLKSDEPMVESAIGSQFEQKTFSRMRDGEMVQVSYKVYIPKKTPALARRQLQR